MLSGQRVLSTHPSRRWISSLSWGLGSTLVRLSTPCQEVNRRSVVMTMTMQNMLLRGFRSSWVRSPIGYIINRSEYDWRTIVLRLVSTVHATSGSSSNRKQTKVSTVFILSRSQLDRRLNFVAIQSIETRQPIASCVKLKDMPKAGHGLNVRRTMYDGPWQRCSCGGGGTIALPRVADVTLGPVFRLPVLTRLAAG